MGIYEVMEVNPEIRKLIHHAAPAHLIRAAVQQCGMLTLREEGVLLATAEKSSLEEVLRVTRLEEMDEEENQQNGTKIAEDSPDTPSNEPAMAIESEATS